MRFGKNKNGLWLPSFGITKSERRGFRKGNIGIGFGCCCDTVTPGYSCASCSGQTPATILVTVSGLTGCCADLNGSFEIDQYGSSGYEACEYRSASEIDVCDSYYYQSNFQFLIAYSAGVTYIYGSWVLLWHPGSPGYIGINFYNTTISDCMDFDVTFNTLVKLCDSTPVVNVVPV